MMGFPYFKQRELRVEERFHQNQRLFFESLIIGIASPEQIRGWARRTLPNGSVVGEVANARTVDYKTLKPLAGGLFCERIFGPVKDYHCACGKRQPEKKVRFCPNCEVEYYPATIRRHRLGYIELFSGCAHNWYFRGRPNYLSMLLAKKRKSLDMLIYCTKVLVNPHTVGIVPKYVATNNVSIPLKQRYCSGQTIPVAANCACDSQRQRGLFIYMISVGEPEDQTIPYYCSGKKYTSTLATAKPKDDETTSRMPFHDLLKECENERDAKVQRILNKLGGQAIANIMNKLELGRLSYYLAHEIELISPDIRQYASIHYPLPSQQRITRKLIFKRLAWIRRFKLIRTFEQTRRNPAWMVLSALPVLPPTIRPISMMENGTMMASDLNRLYQRVLYRNNRMKRLPILDIDTIGFSQRLLQEAVEAVLENGKGGSIPALGQDNRPLKSLAERLKGKRGRFRLNLLGKRVDYSGRSVIVVGPKMRLHECGLPREMALKLFAPFVMRRLLEIGYANNYVKARAYIQIQHPAVWTILLEIMGQYPILLNRAPTLHRLGIQAFQPRLVATQTILLHPLVCSAFNADFDGDQMAVHVPFSFHARAEAWKLMWSRNNLLAPATGDPILAPSQDMILGSYYLTTSGKPYTAKRQKLGLSDEASPLSASRLMSGVTMSTEGQTPTFYFNDAEDVLRAFYQHFIGVRTPIWLRLPLGQTSQNTDRPQEPEEVQIHADGLGFAVFEDVQQRRRWSVSTNAPAFFTAYAIIVSQCVRTTAGRVLMNHMMTSEEVTIPSLAQSGVNDMLEDMFETIHAREATDRRVFWEPKDEEPDEPRRLRPFS